MAVKQDDLTQDEVRYILDYKPEDGTFWWKIRKLRSRVGDRAGYLGGKGYRQIEIAGKHYYEHRLAVLYMVGAWPQSEVDHIDGIRTNNAWSNLRVATTQENAFNAVRKRRKQKGSLVGAHWDERRTMWMATARIDKKTRYLGSFVTEQEAHDAYINATKHVHGDFAARMSR